MSLSRHADGSIDAFCPCCSDPMDPALVVCPDCWRYTAHLTPGEYGTGFGSTTFTLTQAEIKAWTQRRTRRVEGSA